MTKLQTTNHKIKNGFSLVELIVVVTIIAVLTVVGATSFAAVSKRSRDSKRIADLQKYAIALESYKQINGNYPVDLPTLVTATLLSGTAVDPKGYQYVYGRPTLYTYGLYAWVEDATISNGSWTSSSCSGVGCACNSGCNYQVLNP